MAGFRIPGPLGRQTLTCPTDTFIGRNAFKPGVLNGDVRPEQYGLQNGQLRLFGRSETISFSFQISSGTLTVVSRYDCRTLRATSGRPESCMNKAEVLCQMLKSTGPLPVGKYFIKPHELSAQGTLFSTVRTIYRWADWGSFRVRLHPEPETMTYGRDNFFLHGGIYPGSAGCIDIGGGLSGDRNTRYVVDTIRRAIGIIEVEVLP
ncbi:DUF2778 domain-containing protein [Pseudomonas sp. RIT-PI-AD]|uniref:DUF2778 domain-containing protein n=1 Tax=Pseudomonas sp. RIT-PI-AD TaxID=3035294 RepID=UPI0021DA56B2|nr:DUF2778 domain-containing protein [Pseudomonas sp. RIT-PI-AD]